MWIQNWNTLLNMKTSLFVLIIFVPAFCLSQNSSVCYDYYMNYYSIKTDNSITKKTNSDYRYSGINESILIKPFSFIIWFYKQHISEQLASDCSFEPSCSRFSYRSIHEFGLLKGIILTADRLTRCNDHAYPDAPRYLININNAKVIDNPSFYRFNN